MSYEGIFTNAFKKDLKLINKKHPKDAKQILHSIEHIILSDHFTANTKQLQCFEYCRYRVRKYRIVFDIDDMHNTIFYAVDQRSSIYNKIRQV